MREGPTGGLGLLHVSELDGLLDLGQGLPAGAVVPEVSRADGVGRPPPVLAAQLLLNLVHFG